MTPAVHPAPVLDRLRLAMDQRWPDRSRLIDGWIGDAAHQASGPPEQGGSDHNANVRNTVDGRDIDPDLARQGQPGAVHIPSVIAAAIMCPSTNYVIWRRRIMDRDRSLFLPRAYLGKDPHVNHIHLSIYQSLGAEISEWSWQEILRAPSWGTLTMRVRPDQMAAGVLPTTADRQLQAVLNGWGYALVCDGIFGPRTLEVVKRFQVDQRVARSVFGGQGDGVVGAQTHAALWGLPAPV